MKMFPNEVHPSKNGSYFVLNIRGHLGFAFFIDGKWYSEPSKEEIKDKYFGWIDIYDQLERLNGKTSKEDAIV
jgi:hypothetical protein